MAKNKTKTTMETSFSSTSKSFPQTLHFDFDLKKKIIIKFGTHSANLALR